MCPGPFEGVVVVCARTVLGSAPRHAWGARSRARGTIVGGQAMHHGLRGLNGANQQRDANPFRHKLKLPAPRRVSIDRGPAHRAAPRCPRAGRAAQPTCAQATRAGPARGPPARSCGRGSAGSGAADLAASAVRRGVTPQPTALGRPRGQASSHSLGQPRGQASSHSLGQPRGKADVAREDGVGLVHEVGQVLRGHRGGGEHAGLRGARAWRGGRGRCGGGGGGRGP